MASGGKIGILTGGGDVPGGKPARKLAKLLAPLADEYDAVFLDCPPSVSLVSENVLQAADVILVPLIPTTLSVRTLEQLAAFVGEFNGHRPELLAFFSMVDRRKKLHREITEKLSVERTEVARTVIPALSVIETMSVERAPVAVFAPNTAATRAYRGLWAELRAFGDAAAQAKGREALRRLHYVATIYLNQSEFDQFNHWNGLLAAKAQAAGDQRYAARHGEQDENTDDGVADNDKRMPRAF